MGLEIKSHEIPASKSKEITSSEKRAILDVSNTKEFKEAEQNTKRIISEYNENIRPDIDVKPMESIYSQKWRRIKLKKDIDANLKECNPNFELGREWRINCQRCVPTFEMRNRGYDVTAYPKPLNPDRTDLSYNPFAVWQNPKVIECSKNGFEDIEKKMEEWGDGARAQVVVVWKNTNAGHTFVAERVDGKTIYVDPQSGNKDVKSYFSRVQDGSVRLARIDNLDVTSRILDCCRKA